MQVPHRGTSARCAGWGAALEGPEGYRSAACPGCGLSGGRDVMAVVNIARRALLGKAAISHPKDRPKRIRTVLHEPVELFASLPVPTGHIRRMSDTRTATLPERRLQVPKGGLTREMRTAASPVEPFPCEAVDVEHGRAHPFAGALQPCGEGDRFSRAPSRRPEETLLAFLRRWNVASAGLRYLGSGRVAASAGVLRRALDTVKKPLSQKMNAKAPGVVLCSSQCKAVEVVDENMSRLSLVFLFEMQRLDDLSEQRVEVQLGRSCR
ncbi:hypothetical protein [Deinococcus hopiensis]|uniref:hypothetical protein n=1 Tax=Deinococcus hopiensis TaxID=309885 RepID=UPI003CCBE4AD